MALLPEQKEIAAVVGYTPLEGAEGEEQYPVTPDFDPDKQGPEYLPCTGSCYRSKRGKLRIYWIPAGRNYRNERDSLTGWYDVPTLEDVEEWTFDSTCPTPAEDDVEPDHPDSWLSILGLI